MFNTSKPNAEITGIIHLGKGSAGWKFLWNPNIYIIKNGHVEKEEIEKGHHSYKYIPESDTAFYVYPLTKKGIKEFLDREDVEVYDEYGEKEDKEIFYQEAINHVTWKNPKTGEIREAWDSKTYREDKNNDTTEHCCYRCGGDLVNYLINSGIKFISYNRSDFYSDGLRFASTIDFS
jgi:hypothetical protein